MNFPFALHVLPALVPCPALGLVGSGSVNLNLTSSSEISVTLEEGNQGYDPGADTQSDLVLLPASLAQAMWLKKRQAESPRK